MTDITMGILSIFSNAIINQISMNYDVAEIKIHYNLTGKRVEGSYLKSVEGCRRRLETDGVRSPITGLRCNKLHYRCLNILIKMLTPFSKDSIIISNIPVYIKTTNRRNTMEQYLWFQDRIVDF